jgi:hypothetical protein
MHSFKLVKLKDDSNAELNEIWSRGDPSIFIKRLIWDYIERREI